MGSVPAFAAEPPVGGGVSPKSALERLQAGNARFVSGTLTHNSLVDERRAALTGGQAPFATILSCSDSRVPPEHVFDESLGDLFVARNAGNFVTDAVLGTIEYGYAVLGVKLIVVLGHESCGAISATYDAIANEKPLPPHLDAIQRGIESGIQSVVTAHGSKDDATRANAKAQAALLASSSPVLAPAVKSGDLHIVSAVYTLADGKVTMLS
ncbi:MAG: carbonic anhydrase [Candidatus Baltobacteraceae bacterium]